MGWKIGTVALGFTALSLVVWDVVLLIGLMHEQCKQEVQKVRNEDLEMLLEVQGEMLADKK